VCLAGVGDRETHFSKKFFDLNSKFANKIKVLRTIFTDYFLAATTNSSFNNLISTLNSVNKISFKPYPNILKNKINEYSINSKELYQFIFE
jgi:hypothetical protein